MTTARQPMRPTVALLSCLWLSLAGEAQAASDGAGAGGVASAADCPRLFGDPAAHRANEQHRRKHLYWVEGGRPMVIVHGSDSWVEPRAVRFRGLALVEARSGLVEVARDTALGFGCEPRRYRLQQDDTIGRARVLAVLATGLLVELRGELRFWQQEKREVPEWIMAWGSRWRIASTRGWGRASPPAPPPKAPRRR